MLNKAIVQPILNRYQGIKLYNMSNPVLLSGYKALQKPFEFKFRSDIIGIINRRAYYVRTSKIMSEVINKFKLQTYATTNNFR